jgi:hypothetical protein
MERITRELRAIGRHPSAPGPAPQIGAVSPTSVTFGAGVSIARSGSQLLLTPVSGAPEILLTNVTGFSVQTYDDAGAALGGTLSGTSCYPIRRIQVQATVQDQGVTQSLRTRIFVRGVMSGAQP